MNMYICMKINYINNPFIKFKVMASLCSHYFIGWNFWSMGFDLHDSISEWYLFLTSAIEIIVCQNPVAIHESMLSDVHIGEKIPLHDNGVTTFTIHVINVMFRHSYNKNMSTLYLTPPPPPPIGESKPLVAIDNLGWAISLRKLNRDLEEKTKPVSHIHKTFILLLGRGSQLSSSAQF